MGLPDSSPQGPRAAAIPAPGGNGIPIDEMAVAIHLVGKKVKSGDDDGNEFMPCWIHVMTMGTAGPAGSPYGVEYSMQPKNLSIIMSDEHNI